MKKMIGPGVALAMVLVMMLSLAACGGTGGGNTDETESVGTTDETESIVETAETAETTETAEIAETETTFDPNGPRHRITVREGDEDLASDVPESAVVGETVTITTVSVCDADLYVSINGDREFGHFTRDGSYEFMMPDEDVEIAVVIISNGLA